LNGTIPVRFQTEGDNAMSAKTTRRAVSSQCDPTAMSARAEQIIDLMNTRYVDENWSPPVRKDADRFLDYFDALARNHDWDDRDGWEFVIAFCRRYNQSLDWILCGNPGGMICAMAATSQSVQQRAAA
jgi:hypothetical protein